MTSTQSREQAAAEALVISLDEYIRARYGLIAVQTFEEERFLRFMRGVAEHERHRAKGLYCWSRTRGLRLLSGPGSTTEPRVIAGKEDALSVIEYIEEAEQGLYVLCDYAPYLLEYGAPKPDLVRRFRELAWAIRSRPVTVIFLGARLLDPPRSLRALNLLVNLHLESGSVAQAHEILARADQLGGPDAETYRLDALVNVFERDLARARVAVQHACELAPRWVSVRVAAGVVEYFSGLAPLGVPARPVDWPEPVDWMVVKRDQETLLRFRSAAARFHELAGMTDLADDHRTLYRVWRLACLANDPSAQDEALALCKNLLAEDPANFEAVAWATARSYEFDLKATEEAIGHRLANGTAVVPHVVALSRAYLADGNANKALALLQQSRDLFSNPPATQLWKLLNVQAAELAGANVDDAQVYPTVPSVNPVIERQARAIFLLAQAKRTNDWQPLVDHLLESHDQTGDAEFLLQACEIMASRERWEFVADRASWLVDEVATAEAFRLAVHAAYVSKRPKQALELLETGSTLFESAQLPLDLRRIRIQCQVELGILSGAITEAQALVESDPSAENLLALASLHFAKGDLASLGQVARKAMQLPDLISDQVLQIALWTRVADRPLAIQTLRRALDLGIPDNAVGLAISIGFELGLDQEMGPLFQRLTSLAAAGQGNVKLANLEDLRSWIQERQTQTAELDARYRSAQLPIHLIGGQLRLPLVELYHRRLTENAVHPDPLHQFALLVRHGGRGTSPPLSVGLPQVRLHADVTAILLAGHFELLDLAETTLGPIRIPQSLVPALLRMRDAVTDHQPTRLAAQLEVDRLLDEGLLLVVDCEALNVVLDPELEKEVGEHWARFYASAESVGASLVDFLPLLKADVSGAVANISPQVRLQLINCRAVVDALRAQGPLSEEEHTRAVAVLGSEGVVTGAPPNQGTAMYLDGTTAELLASAGVLRDACGRFRVSMDKHDAERVRGTLIEHAKRQEVDVWLEQLIRRLSTGIDDGRYIAMDAPEIELDQRDSFGAEPVIQSLRTLLSFTPSTKDLVWIDDRYATAFARQGVAPIIGVAEILSFLRAAGTLSDAAYYGRRHALRSANVRYLPPEAGEVIYHLRQAIVQDGRLIETEELSVLRRYIGASLHQSEWLQKPPLPEGAPNPAGENAFALTIAAEVREVLRQVWAAEVDDATRYAWSEWVLSALYVDFHGLVRVSGLPLSNVGTEDRYLCGLGLAELLALALTLQPQRCAPLIAWLWDRVIQPRISADPLLLASIADVARNAMRGVYEAVRAEYGEATARGTLQSQYFGFPELLRNELARDAEFAALAGVSLSSAILVGDLIFDPDEFFERAEVAVAGDSVVLRTIDRKHEIQMEARTSHQPYTLILTGPRNSGALRISEPEFDLLSHSVTAREEALRQYPEWFDTSVEEFERTVAEIVSLESPRRRVESASAWRKASSTVHYASTLAKVQARIEFPYQELLPPSGLGLVRYFGLEGLLEQAADVRQVIEDASASLSERLGLQAAIERSAGLPVGLPNSLLAGIRALDPPERRTLLGDLTGRLASPVARVHLVLHFAHG